MGIYWSPSEVSEDGWCICVMPGSTGDDSPIVLEAEGGVDNAVPPPGSYGRAYSKGKRLVRFKEQCGEDISVSVEFGATGTAEAGKARVAALISPGREEYRVVDIDADTLRERARDVMDAPSMWEAITEAAIPYLID